MSKEKTPTITQDELKAILADVTAEVNTLVKSEKDKLETLVKSNPGEETPSEPPADTTATKSPPESAGPEASKPEDETPSAAPETDPAAGGPPAAPGGDVPPDPAQDVGPIDPAQLKAEYCQLSVEDLQTHYMAAKEALVEKMAAAQAAVPAAPAGAPAPSAAPVAAPVAAPTPPPAAAPVVPPASPDVPPVIKSEKDLRIEALEKNEKDVGETISKLTDIMTKVLNAPLRKSIVSIKEVETVGDKKTAYKDMTQAQIDAALRSRIETGTLQKSDKDLIIGYDLKKVSIDQLAHLFV